MGHHIYSLSQQVGRGKLTALSRGEYFFREMWYVDGSAPLERRCAVYRFLERSCFVNMYVHFRECCVVNAAQ